MWSWTLDVDFKMFIFASVIVTSMAKLGRKTLTGILTILTLLSAWIAYEVSLQNQFIAKDVPLRSETLNLNQFDF